MATWAPTTSGLFSRRSNPRHNVASDSIDIQYTYRRSMYNARTKPGSRACGASGARGRRADSDGSTSRALHTFTVSYRHEPLTDAGAKDEDGRSYFFARLRTKQRARAANCASHAPFSSWPSATFCRKHAPYADTSLGHVASIFAKTEPSRGADVAAAVGVIPSRVSF